MLGNAVRLNSINDKISALKTEEEENPDIVNDYKYWYYVGVVSRILLVFEPVSE